MKAYGKTQKDIMVHSIIKTNLLLFFITFSSIVFAEKFQFVPKECKLFGLPLGEKKLENFNGDLVSFECEMNPKKTENVICKNNNKESAETVYKVVKVNVKSKQMIFESNSANVKLIFNLGQSNYILSQVNVIDFPNGHTLISKTCFGNVVMKKP